MSKLGQAGSIEGLAHVCQIATAGGSEKGTCIRNYFLMDWCEGKGMDQE